MEVINTKNIMLGKLKFLVHGPSGAGKTRLCGTTGGKPLIISAEAGLLSLRGQDLDVVEVRTIDQMREIYNYLLTDTKYDWVCLDSISEIAEKILSKEKASTKDGRMAYGEMSDKVIGMVKDFRDLNKNVYMCSKQAAVKDEVTGGFLMGCLMPGKQAGPALPYLFDEVFSLHSWKDAEGKIQRALQTTRDAQYEAKDRSGSLEFVEPADLSHICRKIFSNQQPTGV